MRSDGPSELVTPPKLYVITRRDLSPGDQAAQAVHAALAFCLENLDVSRPWYRDSNYLVILSVPDESALLALSELAAGKRWLQREEDLDDQATALVLEPDNAANRRLLSSYPLAFKEFRELAPMV